MEMRTFMFTGILYDNIDKMDIVWKFQFWSGLDALCYTYSRLYEWKDSGLKVQEGWTLEQLY